MEVNYIAIYPIISFSSLSLRVFPLNMYFMVSSFQKKPFLRKLSNVYFLVSMDYQIILPSNYIIARLILHIS